jgi:hypothetical protein
VHHDPPETTPEFPDELELEEDVDGVEVGDCSWSSLLEVVADESSPDDEVDEVDEEETVCAVPDECVALYWCSAAIATPPVSPIAPTTIQFVALEISRNPLSRLSVARFMLMPALSAGDSRTD